MVIPLRRLTSYVHKNRKPVEESRRMRARSDHGCKEEFDQMLQQIDFSQYDTLWILGDVCDRGNESVALLQEIMAHANMHMIMGNHDVWLSRYAQKLIDAKKDPGSIEMNDDFLIWMHYNGGFKTADEFMMPTSMSSPILTPSLTSLAFSSSNRALP